MKILTKKTNNLKKKIFVIILAFCLVLTNVMPAQSLEAAPTPPPPPPSAPEPPSAPTLEEILAPTSLPTAVPTAQPSSTPEPLVEETTPTPSPEPSPDPTSLVGEEADNSSESGISQTGLVGDTTVQTGGATNSVSLTTEANTNLSSESGNESVSQTTEESNAASSESDQTITVIDESSITQDNQASVVNTLEESTVTGENSASLNVGDSTIVTGDANTSGTIITAVNTNVSGVSVAEFNVVDDQVGDIILDFGESAPATASASSSSNESEVTVVEDSETFQNNEAVLENNLVLISDTGHNETSLNTNGDSTIETGDANVSALVLSFVNNNLAGNVVLGVVNIFGNLVGDIILPEEELAQSTNCSSPQAQEVTVLDTQTTFQTNDADIENNLILAANTGENEASRNTGGQTSVQTGEAEVQTQVVNVANANIEGGSWWLVIVNEAGEWIGKILGAPEEANFAGSSGTEIRMDGNGQIIASGEGGVVNQTSTNSLEQNNQAQITNNIELAANTGKNKANDNTGGNTSINTGDAKVIANIINFVNSNISSDSKLIVTVVNVFGSWIGNFLPPGYEKEADDDDDDDDDDAGDNDDNDDNNNDDSNDGEGDNNDGNDGNGGDGGDGGENGNNENNGDGGSKPEEDGEDVVLTSARRLKGGSFVYSSYESYEAPDGSALAAQANETDWGEKPVRVNLAWLTLTIPLFLLLALIRKIAFH
jgi:hypothetical protein